MTSKKASELFGEDDLPTTGDDVHALRRDRPQAADGWLAQLTVLAAQAPQIPAGRRERRTFASLPPFEL
jgi:hypothetical protein